MAKNTEATKTDEATESIAGELIEVRYEYTELRPWARETLVEQLNAAAADGWKLAAVVGSQIILERAR